MTFIYTYAVFVTFLLLGSWKERDMATSLQLWVWPNLRRRLFPWKRQRLWLCWMSKIATTDPLRRSLHGWCCRSPRCHWWPQQPKSGVAALGGVCLQRSTAQSQVTWDLARCECMNAVFKKKKLKKREKHMVSQALWKVILLFFRFSLACRRKLLEDLMSRVCDLNACANASGKGRSDMTVNVLEAAADIFLQKDRGWSQRIISRCTVLLSSSLHSELGC